MIYIHCIIIQHLILPNQSEGTLLYWTGYFLRDFVLGGLIGIAWAYFLHPNSETLDEKLAVSVELL